MNPQDLVMEIFESMPGRYRKEQADEKLSAELGFDIRGNSWTLLINGKTCEVSRTLSKNNAALIRTGPEEWIGIATGAADPVALFLNKKLTVEGNLDVALTVMNLFDNFTSDQISVKDPSWIVDTLGGHFKVRDDGHFMIEEIDCAVLAEKYGTPLFVTSENQVRENIRTMKEAFKSAYPENHVNVMWAVKSNTSIALRKIMNQEGAGGDCFSPGEIHATFITGADPGLFVLNGSDRSDEAFRMAIDIGMLITLDHIDDLFIVEKIARESGRTVKALIRLKCELPSLKDVESTFEPGITLPLEVLNLKFGVTYAEAVEIAKAARSFFPLITIEGIHSHIGRDVHLPEHWHGYAYDMVEHCRRFRGDTGIEAKILDLGGGFSEKRDPSGHDLTRLAAPIEDYANAISEGIRGGCKEFDFPYPKLWVEPGRHLIGPTTVLISRVGNVKRTPGVCTWAHVDASCNFLPSVERHNGMSYHLLPGTNARAKAEETVDVVGPNCSGDIIQPRRKLPRLQRGDLLIFLDVGAYNLVAANQFNSIPRPASVLVCGSRADVIQERETLADIFARQKIPARLMV